MTVLDDAERARLAAAYCHTAYRVSLADGPAVLRIGMPWQEIDHRLAGSIARFAYVTAVNPASRILDAFDNARRQRALLDDIMVLGYSALPGVAVADDANWPDEPGFLVADLPLETARALAVRYGQHAFLHAEAGGPVHLIWCDVNKSMQP